MPENGNILIAADSVNDADLICKMLRQEFDRVAVSTDPAKAVDDFERCGPAVLVLAFSTLAKAQAYYLGLYRLSSQVHGMVYKTLILCRKDELNEVYTLCKKEHFDNYVLFWPLGYDSTRLPMEVHRAFKQLSTHKPDVPSANEFAAQARHIAGLEALLNQSLDKGGEHIELSQNALAQAGTDIGLALEGFSRRIVEQQGMGLAGNGTTRATAIAAVEAEVGRLKTNQIDKHLRSAVAAVQPLRQWTDRLKADLAPQFASLRAMQKLTARVRPLVLVVDDDEFQHKLLAGMLSGEDVELMFSHSSNEALACLHRRRPDLVLMDVNLPDLDGVETTRRLKSIEQFSTIPVVMITGNSHKDVVVRSLKAGAVDFVVKPFDKAIMLNKLRTMLSF